MNISRGDAEEFYGLCKGELMGYLEDKSFCQTMVLWGNFGGYSAGWLGNWERRGIGVEGMWVKQGGGGYLGDEAGDASEGEIVGR